jgi:hypothetical protein
LAPAGAIVVACLFGSILPASASAKLQAQLPGVAVEGDDLLVALPIQNAGDTTAFRVVVTEIELQRGRLDAPTLPVQLGTIAPDDSPVINLRFDVRRLVPASTLELEIEGRYVDPRDADDRRDRDHDHDRDGDRDRDRRDRDDFHRFHIHTTVQVPAAAPGSATIGTNQGGTHTTQGPYPALGVTPQTDDNEFRPPTPIGTPRLIFLPTATGTPAQNPGGAGAGVSFVFDTQSGGIANRFPPDPSAVGSGSSGNVVLATGNLYIKYSTDGGSTFKTISDLSTVFGDTPDGGYCCDQVVHYVPSIDRMVWLIQTNQATGGHNSLRVAWAKPADIAANFYTAWTWFDVSSTFLGLGNDALDYPDISTANGHLYVSVDDLKVGGLVVARISYSDMLLPGGSIVTWEFTHPADSTSANSSHMTQNAADTMYWAGHNTTSQLRIFRWGDSSNTYSWIDVNNTSYSTSDYTSKAPDGQYWLDPRPKGDSIIGAVRKPFVGLVAPGQPTPPDQLWFAWDAGRDSTFAQPYIRIAMIDAQAFNNVGELEVWNSSYAFAYPALNVNPSTSEVAISLMWGGGGSFFMNHAVGFLGDFVVYITTASDVTFTANPATSFGCDDASKGAVSGRCTRSGDYLSVRRVGTASGLFGTLGYEINLVNSSQSTDCLVSPGCRQNVRWIEWGRPADVNPPPPIN